MSDTARYVLTVTGSDRPGLTSELSEAVLAAQGNWKEGHLSRLGGLYVGSVLVEIEPEQKSNLEQAIAAIDGGLEVRIFPAESDADTSGSLLLFELVGQDRPGIIKQVSSVLAGLGANIESLSSGEEMGAWGGEHLFRAEVLAILPDGVTPEQGQAALEEISSEIMVDFSFQKDFG
ncbi:glycine cleavage system protein R [Altererythrobacter lutimaris]|uniref:ACT domain-containing protein n=1 Tax=Altererythrobacter lutimaris TaxID=2743979 RepID=A0A850HCN9_9SPHN|nr:ACT domain-containing protein [Altererythrobacter lutimaris]NVE95085.1 ACT domain-containing protein [Altererythrobacter lutimaris]